ncbi:SDR family NAD(P)-dependent oxidoreductase [Nostoc sp.]|uniref:SDR family NAD(P)-dependent oxidoreductase n=1 Tax=Nostoc sp. TaxID=1180 RepID=UPI002FF4E072
MDLQLVGKRALITGSSSGIGSAIARRLAREGASVAVHGRDAARAGEVAESIRSTGGQAVVVIGDLVRADEAVRVADNASRLLGGVVDVLVNNAGGGGGAGQSWEAANADDWADVYARNALAIVRLAARLLPAMRAQRWGRVVNISSGAGELPGSSAGAYAAAKAAVNNLTVSMSREVGRDGVTVNAVSPGPIRTPALERSFAAFAQQRGLHGTREEVERAVLDARGFGLAVPRVGEPEEIADAVTFLCSPLAGFITGANLRVDGGLVPTV